MKGNQKSRKFYEHSEISFSVAFTNAAAKDFKE